MAAQFFEMSKPFLADVAPDGTQDRIALTAAVRKGRLCSSNRDSIGLMVS
jgi:hypothetical protein